MYIVTSKPKRISVYSGLVHMRSIPPFHYAAILTLRRPGAHREIARSGLMIFLSLSCPARYARQILNIGIDPMPPRVKTP
jgi:hypothetical protein